MHKNDRGGSILSDVVLVALITMTASFGATLVGLSWNKAREIEVEKRAALIDFKSSARLTYVAYQRGLYDREDEITTGKLITLLISAESRLVSALPNLENQARTITQKLTSSITVGPEPYDRDNAEAFENDISSLHM